MRRDRGTYREENYVPDTFWLVVAVLLFAACGLVWLIGQVAALWPGTADRSAASYRGAPSCSTSTSPNSLAREGDQLIRRRGHGDVDVHAYRLLSRRADPLQGRRGIENISHDDGRTAWDRVYAMAWPVHLAPPVTTSRRDACCPPTSPALALHS